MAEKMNFEELQEIVSICMDEIVKLKQENAELKKKIGDMSSILSGIVKGQKMLLDNTEKLNDDITLNLLLINNGLNNIKYELSDPRMNKEDLYFPQFFDIEDTIDMIVNGKRSMARFGDGEFAIMVNEQRQRFQRSDQRLADRLKEVISSNEEGFLIGIADNYGSLEKYNRAGRQGIRMYMTEAVRREHKKFLNIDRRYHNAYISRPYALLADNNTDAPGKRFANLKRIWEKRNVIMVEGSLTRLGVGNNLFDNVASIRRIEAPSVNAFDKYDEILRVALQKGDKDTLFLIALGPTAGVLAYDLFQKGFQALDVGHIDLEYEWYRRGKGGRCEVKTKYNNELKGGDLVEDIEDTEYLKQIIYVIGDK